MGRWWRRGGRQDDQDGDEDDGDGGERSHDIDLAEERVAMTLCPPQPVRNRAELFYYQLLVMTKKNAILLGLRYWKSTVAQCLFPIFIMLILFLLQYGFKVTQPGAVLHPKAYTLEPVEACMGNNDAPCITLMFSPDTGETRSIMEQFVNMNNYRSNETWSIESSVFTSLSPPETTIHVTAVPDADFIYNYTYTNPNITKFAIVFDFVPSNYRYQIWYNSSMLLNSTYQTDPYGRQLLSLMRGIDEATIGYASNIFDMRGPEMTIDIKDWPSESAATSEVVVLAGGPMFFYACTILNFLMVVYLMLGEKEAKLRQSMELMGLMPSVYWVSWFVTYLPLVFVISLATVAFGYIFNFSVFTNTDFGVIFLLFFLHGVSMVFVGFFVVTITNQVRAGVLAGLFFVIIGLAFMIVVFSNQFIGYIWWSSVTNPPAGWAVLMFFPFFNFGALLLQVSTLATGSLDETTNSVILGPGFHMSDLQTVIPKQYQPVGDYTLTPPAYALYFFLLDMAVYSLLTWYCDKVFPDPFGNQEPFYFFLLPSYWGYYPKGKTNVVRADSTLSDAAKIKEDEDVHEERLLALDESKSSDWAIRVVNIRKVFKFLFGPGEPKVAVNSLSLTLKEGELLALLGQNGAGKTTSINILCGFARQTSGEAYLNGLNIRTQMQQIRTILGVCPQHDILFPDLTAYEHLELFAGIKHVAKESVPKLIRERLQAVRLWRVRDKKAGTFSGGMKRRLSVAISTIGDPKILFMDEPTTGMDPVNRRYVWKFIEQFKQGRAIVLTTHSMEEADVLGDVIAIMALGNLIALGNSVRLKNKFGSGYRFSAVTEEQNVASVKDIVTKVISDAKVEDDSAGAMVFNIPSSSCHLIPDLIRSLRDYPDLVREWGLSQTTLEDTFLRLIRSVNPTNIKTLKNK